MYVYVLFLLLLLLFFSFTHIYTYIHTYINLHTGSTRKYAPGKKAARQRFLINTHIHTLTPMERIGMVRKDGAEVRRERIQQITIRVLSLLHKHGEISLKKTLATLEYETGLKRETLREYLKTGEDTDHFILDIENDKIKRVAEVDSDE